MARLGADPEGVARVQARLAPLRRQLRRLDRLTWETGQVTGQENFLWLISSSDFASDLTADEQRLTAFLNEAEERPVAADGRVRLGFAGIPPILTDLWPFLAELGADVAFHEFPRQFSMPDAGPDLVEQYLRYTYPYDIGGRLADLKEAVATRRLDGLVHYTQSFCFRQMFDQFLRDHLDLPLLTIEGDRPTTLDSRTRMRLAAFSTSCGLKSLGEGAKGMVIRGPYHQLPQSPYPLPHPPVGVHPCVRPGRSNGSALTRVGKGTRGEGRDHLRKSPRPPPQTWAYGLDFGSRPVKLVYARGGGGWGRRRLDSIIFTGIIWCGSRERCRSIGAGWGCPLPGPGWPPGTARIS